MLRSFLCVQFLAVLPVLPLPSFDGGDNQDWQKAELKKLSGRWTTFREEKKDKDNDKISRRRIDLEFTDGEMKVFVYDEKNVERLPYSTKVIGIEKVGLGGLASTFRVDLAVSSTLKNAEIHYDMVGEKLIIVGRIQARPFEGFSLSGEYKRAEKPK